MYINQVDTIFFMESENKKSIIERISDKLKEMVEKVKQKLKEIFATKKAQSIEDTVNKAIEKDPSLKNKKLKMVDYDKLNKLNEATSKELVKSKDPKSVFEKYITKRNAILTGTALSIGAVIAIIRGVKKASNNNTACKCTEDIFDRLDRLNIEHSKFLNAVTGLYTAQAEIVAYGSPEFTSKTDRARVVKELKEKLEYMQKYAAIVYGDDIDAVQGAMDAVSNWLKSTGF